MIHIPAVMKVAPFVTKKGITMFKFELGSEAQDIVTGYVGIIIGRAEHITGCNTYGVQKKTKKNEAPENSVYFDENRLKLTGKKVKVVNSNPDKGGPQQNPKKI